MPQPISKLIPVNAKGSPDLISREYLDSLGFEERLIDSVEPVTDLSLFGCSVSTPIMSAAISGLDRFSENGIEKMARACIAQNTLMWMGISEASEVERACATGAHTIEIMKPYAAHEEVLSRLEHGKCCGLVAMGMDIDHCFAPDGSYGTDRHGTQLKSKSVSDLKDYVHACEGMPFIVKGVLSVHDALAAAEAGARAIVLSHHHGIYPFAVPPLQVLPEIRRAVGNDMKIVVDSNLKDGYDVYKALALGADAVGIGRALLPALTKEGEAGVAAFLQDMNGQLKGIMARTGVKDLCSLDSSVIRRIR